MLLDYGQGRQSHLEVEQSATMMPTRRATLIGSNLFFMFPSLEIATVSCCRNTIQTVRIEMDTFVHKVTSSIIKISSQSQIHFDVWACSLQNLYHTSVFWENVFVSQIIQTVASNLRNIRGSLWSGTRRAALPTVWCVVFFK